MCDASGVMFGPCDCGATPTANVASSSPEPAVPPPPSGAPWGATSSPEQRTFWGGAPAPPQPARRRWYGWQTLIADGAGLLISGIGLPLSLSRSTQSLGTGLLVGGGVVQLIGGPIVHWSHRNVGRGFASLGLRIVLPALGVLLGFATRNEGVLILGSGAGSAVAIALDAAVLAREPEAP